MVRISLTICLTICVTMRYNALVRYMVDVSVLDLNTNLAADQWVRVHHTSRKPRYVAVTHGCEVGDHVSERDEDIVADDGGGGAAQLLRR